MLSRVFSIIPVPLFVLFFIIFILIAYVRWLLYARLNFRPVKNLGPRDFSWCRGLTWILSRSRPLLYNMIVVRRCCGGVSYSSVVVVVVPACLPCSVCVCCCGGGGGVVVMRVFCVE